MRRTLFILAIAAALAGPSIGVSALRSAEISPAQAVLESLPASAQIVLADAHVSLAVDVAAPPEPPEPPDLDFDAPDFDEETLAPLSYEEKRARLDAAKPSALLKLHKRRLVEPALTRRHVPL